MEVAERLQGVFAGLLDAPLEVVTRQTETASVVLLHRPCRNLLPSLVQEDDETWALVLDAPADAALLGAGKRAGATSRKGGLLQACRGLEGDHGRLLRDLSPPLSLVWGTKSTGDVWIANDGLGLGQLFERSDAKGWVVANRVLAFHALGLDVEPDPAQWAVRSVLGWFPLLGTGYRSIDVVPPATRVRIGRAGLQRDSEDVLQHWVVPSVARTDECIDLAQASLEREIDGAQGLWKAARLSLSGGWDSRVVAAVLRSRGVDWSARVTGRPEDADVVVARQLADSASLELSVQTRGGLPPEDPDLLQEAFRSALLWEAGHRVTHKHSTFLVGKKSRHLGKGGVRITGKYGELGRAYYVEKGGEGLVRPGDDTPFVHLLLDRAPAYLQARHRSHVRDVLFDACRAADRYDLSGVERLDFFYLHERVRRLQAGTHSAKTAFVFTPFLNVGYLRACFSLRGLGKRSSPMHRAILERLAPEWLDVPLASALEAEAPRSPALAAREGEASDWRAATAGAPYDHERYWRSVGRPVVERALETEGFWQEVFDPPAAAERWLEAPEALVMTALLPSVLAALPSP